MLPHSTPVTGSAAEPNGLLSITPLSNPGGSASPATFAFQRKQ